MTCKIALRLACALFLALSSHAAVVFNGSFSGDFAPLNWTEYTGTYSTGSFDVSDAPGSVTLIGSDEGAGSGSGPNDPAVRTSYTIVMPRSGTAHFRWDYQTFDISGPKFDPAGYILNSTFYNLSSDVGSDRQWGLAQVNVNAGDTFGFYINATDNMLGGAELTISTPEPAALLLAGPALICLYFRRRRR